MSLEITLKEFFNLEKKYRKDNQWFFFIGNVVLEDGTRVLVRYKGFGFYIQVFKVGDKETDYSSGHTINKVGFLHQYIRETISENKSTLFPL